jgi:hypothetical protein
MLRRGRPEDQEFALLEQVYRRCRKDAFDSAGRLEVAAMKFPRQSVNRERYSEPADVLFHPDGLYDDFGVFQFQVQDLPPPIGYFAFSVRHAPEEENFSHSEIWSSKSESPDYAEPSKTVKAQFRAHLANRITSANLVIPPAA